MITYLSRLNPLHTLLLCSLVLSSFVGCGAEEETDTTTMEEGSATAGISTQANQMPPNGGATTEAMGEAGEMPPVEPMGGDSTTDAGTDGGEVVIYVAGTDSVMYDPIDESIPGEGIHAFTMTDINGEEVDMRRYRNRVALVINVASRCGYTDQYEDLQTLYETYKDRGLVLLGFPANNFGSQEPGTDEEIAEFCTANYGVTFPMFSKISVKGDDMHPLYGYLTEQSEQAVSWNFNKFLVGTDGLYRAHYLSPIEPLSDELTSAIEALLPNP